ncbi:MAG: exodeoxyribonuclease VII large subunit [Planctomycetes bacterium]|nr:exodeoxyribonuclease VII large subunit [Planctomycetota bacterium]
MDPVSVADLTKQIKRDLEGNFSKVAVTGEIGNFRGAHHSGHVYCNLKDSGAQIKMIIWRGVFQRLRFDIEDGLEVIITGKIDLYAPRGEYSLVASSVQPVGVGGLQLAFQQMVERLDAEGLFLPKHKQELPPYPSRIAVITSPTGAAVHDIISTAKRRNPQVQILICPAKVQGDGSALQIAQAIHRLNELNAQHNIDAIIVGRGGGSLEDLWAFNEEPVARAIFESQIPIVSAVGHEVDTTIADLVADYRAPTPTAAAEILVPEISGQVELVNELQYRLTRGFGHTLELWKQRLETLKSRLINAGPLAQLRREQQRLDYLWDGLSERIQHRLASERAEVSGLAGRLNALSPLAVLDRGYSITRAESGKVLKSGNDVKTGEVIISKLADGEIRSIVE